MRLTTWHLRLGCLAVAGLLVLSAAYGAWAGDVVHVLVSGFALLVALALYPHLHV